MPRIGIIYTTCSDHDSADHLRRKLINQRVVACGNIVNADSCYWWQGEVESANEKVLILKTSVQLINSSIKIIEQYHPYETPCILHWEVEANDGYCQWMESVLG